MNSRYSYDSGANGLATGYRLGSEISKALIDSRMTEDVNTATARQQSQEFRPEQMKDFEEYSKAYPYDTGDANADGSFTYGEGPNKRTVRPGYTLGDEHRDTEFTPAEVRGLNRQAAKDALGKYGTAGAARSVQMDAVDESELKRTGLVRAEALTTKTATMNKDILALSAARDSRPFGTDAYKSYDDEVNRLRGEVMTYADATKAKDADFAAGTTKFKDAAWGASATPKATLEFLKAHAPEDTTFTLHPNQDGSTSLVSDDSKGKAYTIGTFKYWNNDENPNDPQSGRNQFLNGMVPGFAAAARGVLETERTADRLAASGLAKAETAGNASVAAAKQAAGSRIDVAQLGADSKEEIARNKAEAAAANKKIIDPKALEEAVTKHRLNLDEVYAAKIPRGASKDEKRFYAEQINKEVQAYRESITPARVAPANRKAWVEGNMEKNKGFSRAEVEAEYDRRHPGGN